ncbi:retrovirus-related pol polyprotein from transposon TNT 1-94 [Tanacetum coccineum]
MTGDRSRLRNFVKKFIGTVRFGNDHFGAIMGYGDYAIGDSVHMGEVFEIQGRDSCLRNQPVKTTSSRSQQDCQYVCMCARYQSKPTKKHLEAVKQVVKTLEEAHLVVLIIPSSIPSLSLSKLHNPHLFLVLGRSLDYMFLHAYLQQHERHANEVRLMHERNSDPLALVASHQLPPSTYQSHLHTLPNSQLQHHVSPYPVPERDDPIDAINHMMSFLTAVVTSRYPTTNNQLRTSSNPRQQATIYDGKVNVQPVQGRQTTYVAGTTRKYTPGASGRNTGKQRTVICYNCKGEGHIAKQCTKL